MKKHWLDERLGATGKTNGDLADHLGLPRPRISDIKKGMRNVSIQEAVKIANFLDLPLEEVAEKLNPPSAAQ